MESIGRRVAQLRKEAGWNSTSEAYEATIRLADAGKLPEPIRQGTWVSMESREPGRDGPTLRNLLRVRAALSLGLGRPVSLDEIVSGSLFDLAPDEAGAELAAEGARAARQRARRGTRRSNGSPRKGER